MNELTASLVDLVKTATNVEGRLTATAERSKNLAVKGFVGAVVAKEGLSALLMVTVLAVVGALFLGLSQVLAPWIAASGIAVVLVGAWGFGLRKVWKRGAE